MPTGLTFYIGHFATYRRGPAGVNVSRNKTRPSNTNTVMNAKEANMPLKFQDQARDALITAILSTQVAVTERCVFVNCSQSIPDLEAIYLTGIPERALTHALNQSWYGILGIMNESEPREIVFAHVNGIIRHVVCARDWFRVHDRRLIFNLNWLPSSHSYLSLRGVSIASALGNPIPIHSAFLYK